MQLGKNSEPRQSAAEWIWYPGDFEIWLRREVELRRDERLVITPPIWRVDNPYTSVRFTKEFTLAHEEHVDILCDGSMRAVVDGVMMDADLMGIELDPGEHRITVEVVNTVGFPALFVDGASLKSDRTWNVSHLSHSYVKVGCDGFTDPNVPPSAFHLATEPMEAEVVEREAESLFVDFGRETFGYVRVHGVKGNGAIRLQYGESRDEAHDAENCETYDVLEIRTNTAEDLTVPHSRAMRYVKVILIGEVEVEYVTLLYEYLPEVFRGQFRCSNELINRIWDVAAYTFHLNTREFFLDGIKRDRWVWSGDAYQSYLMNYYLFFDQDVTKRTIVALRGKDPLEEHINTIVDYSFYWFMSIHDYYQFTGDLDFVRSQYDKMLSLLQFCMDRTNADGLVEGHDVDWVFVDWADMEKEGELTFEQLLLCMSIETTVQFAELFKDGDTVEKYKSVAQQLRAAIEEIFWDVDQEALIHRRIRGKLDRTITKHPNMFALLYGFLQPDKRAVLRETVLQNPSVPKITTPYMRFYELAALCHVGAHAEVTEEILEYWGGMLDLGATTFWEEYDPTVSLPAQYAMYDRPYGKSLCHAWGASPIYLFGKYYLGVTPAQPGYEEILVQPNLGGLEWIDGTVPTPHGDVKVYMDHNKVEIQSPHDNVRVMLNSSQQPQVTDGEVTELDGGKYEVRMAHGKQVLDIAYHI